VAIAAGTISLYYYLQVLKQIYAGELSAGATPFRPSTASLVPIALLACLVIALGCAPGWLLGKLFIIINSNIIKL
jgi:NADH:ubiquinone oxidoreductase subunit 2 (subunit N)